MVPRVKYAMNYRPKNSFSMSYASRKVIFPGVDNMFLAYTPTAVTEVEEIKQALAVTYKISNLGTAC